MKTILACLLAMTLPGIILPALADEVTTEEIDTLFMETLEALDESEACWKRIAYGRGMEMDISEKARLDGHEYSLRIMSSSTGVAEISLSGWFPDLKTNPDGMLPRGLKAYAACIGAVDTLIPAKNASLVLNPYGVYDLLLEGRIDDPYGFEGWKILDIRPGKTEAAHDSGAYMIMTVNESSFIFTYTAH